MPPRIRRKHDLPLHFQEVLKPIDRWSAGRKYWLLKAIEMKLIERDAAMRLHGLSDEELDAWQQAVDMDGARGLLNRTLVSRRYLMRGGHADPS